MATAASTTTSPSANAHSWLYRALAHFLPAQVPLPVPCPINTTVADLRLILRRIEHARREHARWDGHFLSQTIGRVVIAPLEDLHLREDLQRLRHGAIFALQPIAAIGVAKARADVDVAGELDGAARLVRVAIAEAERTRAHHC